MSSDSLPLDDLDNLLLYRSRTPGDTYKVVLLLRDGGRRYATPELLRTLLLEARKKEDGFWINTLENAVSFLG